MSWSEIITIEVFWLACALLGLAVGLGLLDLFCKLFDNGENEND